MVSPKIITEITHPIERRWVIKTCLVIIVVGILALCLVIMPGIIFKARFDSSDTMANTLGFGLFFFFYCMVIIGQPLNVVFSKKNYHYTIGEKFIILKQGIFSKSERHIPYGRIQCVYLCQSLLNRMLGLASIGIETASEGAGVAFLEDKKKNQQEGASFMLPLGFFNNRIGIPGLSYDNAVDLRDTLRELIKSNPIEDGQSGL
ncbi:MAG: PH domain-containing protein [Candidatus Omnitrophica bacterium]|nr:PH domain-containing protein [Candidatus Omnitrophota bacterium]